MLQTKIEPMLVKQYGKPSSSKRYPSINDIDGIEDYIIKTWKEKNNNKSKTIETSISNLKDSYYTANIIISDTELKAKLEYEKDKKVKNSINNESDDFN